jgi:hypothetical protein
MKISYLPIIVVAGALSLASANAMPDLGRETGKFIRKDESVPKDVKTFEPARANASRADFDFAVLVPFRPGASKTDLAVLVPLRPGASKTDLTVLVPLHPSASKTDLAVLGSLQPGHRAS